MSIENREAFLDHIATKLGTTRHALKPDSFTPVNDLPNLTLADKTPAELLALVTDVAKTVHTPVIVTTEAELPSVLDQFITEHEVGPILFATNDRPAEFNLTDWQHNLDQQQEVSYWQPAGTREENIARARDANIAITFPDFLLAESATITFATTPGQGRAIHFLPKHYCAVVKKSQIVPRSTQAVAYYEREIKAGNIDPSGINFITGPSNSGDIEMILVTGVHGPLDCTYIVVEDE